MRIFSNCLHIFMMIGSAMTASCVPTSVSSARSQAINNGSGSGGNAVPITSCAKKATGLGIVDGSPTTAYPAVVMLQVPHKDNSWGSCTGTFVSDSTVITAAHCLPCAETTPVILAGNRAVYTSETMVDLNTNGLKAIKAISANDTHCDDKLAVLYQDYSVTDIAVVVFPDHTSADYVTVDTEHKPVGTRVTLVGYGLTNDADNGVSGLASNKVTGTNVLADPPPNVDEITISGQYKIYGSMTSSGSDKGSARAAFGDSGGPLLVDNKIIGEVSNGVDLPFPDGSTRHESTYADLSSEIWQTFKTRAEGLGARFSPLSEVVTKSTSAVASGSIASAAAASGCTP